MVVVLASSAVKPKAMKLVFLASPLSTYHLEERAQIGWLGIMCLSVDYCFSIKASTIKIKLSVLVLYKADLIIII